MPIESDPPFGLNIDLKEFGPTRAFQSGGEFWDTHYQDIIRKHLGEYLPAVKKGTSSGRNIARFTRIGRQHGGLWASKPVGTRPVPVHLIRGLAKAWVDFEISAGKPGVQPHAKELIEAFTLPDPSKDPELYRLSGPFFSRKLHILWGCERGKKTSVPPFAAIKALAGQSGPKAIAAAEKEANRKPPIDQPPESVTPPMPPGNGRDIVDELVIKDPPPQIIHVPWWKRLPWWIWLLLLALLALLIFGLAKGWKHQVKPPEFDPVPGQYASPLSVAISSRTKGAEIRFVLDNGDPDGPDGWAFTEPIVLLDSTTIKAIAIMDGMQPSEVRNAEYSIRDSSPQTPNDQPSDYGATPLPTPTTQPTLIPTTTPTPTPSPIPTSVPVVQTTPPTNARERPSSPTEATVLFITGHVGNAPNGRQGWCFVDGAFVCGTETSGDRGTINMAVDPGIKALRVVVWTGSAFMTETETLNVGPGDVATYRVASGGQNLLLALESMNGNSPSQSDWVHLDSPTLSNSSSIRTVSLEARRALERAKEEMDGRPKCYYWTVGLPDVLGGARELDLEQLNRTFDWLLRADPESGPELRALKSSLDGQFLAVGNN